jgi:hypothetical protein
VLTPAPCFTSYDHTAGAVGGRAILLVDGLEA